jgi:hypothetical protein
VFEIADLISFLGWCTLINLAMLCLATVVLTSMRGSILSMHRTLFDIAEEELLRLYMQYLANYKIVFLVFNLVPYLALRITGS